MTPFFEATEQQKELARIGREMMNFSEQYPALKGLKEAQFKTLNQLSAVGNMMTAYGAPWGTRFSDFSEDDLELIAKFMKKELDVQTV
jgi:hypothetical protein